MTSLQDTSATDAGAAHPRADVDAGEALSPDRIDPLLRAALEEDCGPDDVTSTACMGAEQRARGRLLAKQAGVLAGLPLFERVFVLCDPEVRVQRKRADGEPVRPDEVVALVEGTARALLRAERTALNFVQRLSGIASLTARYVAAVGGVARVLDTRKTTPLHRGLEKYAVRCGGGENHRFGLHDEAMIKDNHLDLSGEGVDELLARVRAHGGPGLRITVESRSREEALAAARGGADVVMLDNMEAEEMAGLCAEVRAAAEAVAGRSSPVEIEASGGICLESLGRVAACGVDRISVGALTHSAPALDMSLKLERLA